MVRISLPLLLLVVCVTAVVARRPRMLPWVLIVFAGWFVIAQIRNGSRPRR